MEIFPTLRIFREFRLLICYKYFTIDLFSYVTIRSHGVFPSRRRLRFNHSNGAIEICRRKKGNSGKVLKYSLSTFIKLLVVGWLQPSTCDRTRKSTIWY